MSSLLLYFTLLPLAGFFVSLLIDRKKERIMTALVWGAMGLQLAGLIYYTGAWLNAGAPVWEAREWTVYRSAHFEFFIYFCFDRFTAVFALCGAVLFALVAVFSRYYMHRDEGFKRYFNTLLLFNAAYNLIVFSGNFETLFVGWEALGIASFLLIAYYRNRYLPVRNGLKVLSFYRFGDMCLVLAMWMSHHLWHKNVVFSAFLDAESVRAAADAHPGAFIFIAVAIVLAAAVKSAQMPFFTWLPRAMEGPTSSSAIFYGALSVHIGVFVLLRTYPFWSEVGAIKILIVAIGLLTSILTTMIARVQTSVKTQIAYASAAQIGLMFVETALGLHTLALVHFVGNACLRVYQLLVSPSTLSYWVHDMFFHFKPAAPQTSRWRSALYLLAVKEWNFDQNCRRFAWRPFKRIGLWWNHYPWSASFAIWPLLALAGLTASLVAPTPMVAPLFALLAVVATLSALAERRNARLAWLAALAAQCFVALSVFNHAPEAAGDMRWFFSGVAVAGATGYWALLKIESIDRDIELERYHGYVYEQKGWALLFLLSALGVSDFPISPTFVGLDLLWTRIGPDQPVLVALLALNFLFIELAVLRVYVRVFLGQHKKAYHPVAFKTT